MAQAATASLTSIARVVMAAVENASCAAEMNTAAENATSVEVGLNALAAKSSAASVKMAFLTHAQQAASAATQALLDAALLSESPRPGTIQHTTLHAHTIAAHAACAAVAEDSQSRRMYTAHARDRRAGTSEIVRDEAVRKHIDKQARGQLRTVTVYEGMRAVLTHNKSISTDFLNGSTGVVTGVHADVNADPKVMYFDADGASKGAPDLRVAPKATPAKTSIGEVERIQFPLLPAHCVTVHRVQGCTIEDELHVLLNKEFFAEGQA